MPTGMQVERQDFNSPVDHAVTIVLKLTEAESNVGATITVNLDGTQRTAEPVGTSKSSKADEKKKRERELSIAEFYNIDAVTYRRTLHFDGGGISGLSKCQQGDAANRWNVPPYGSLRVSEPTASLMSVPPVEEAFLVRIATSLTPLTFARSELLPPGRMYIIHRGMALLRKRWLGVGAMWGLEMVLQDQYTTQYAANAVTHLEVFYIDRASMLAIAAQYENAALRLRRWTILRALRSFMIANFQALRVGAQGMEAQAEAPGGAQEEGLYRRRRRYNIEGIAPELRSSASRPSDEPSAAAAGNSSVIGGDVAALRDEVATLREDMDSVKSMLVQILERTAPSLAPAASSKRS